MKHKHLFFSTVVMLVFCFAFTSSFAMTKNLKQKKAAIEAIQILDSSPKKCKKIKPVMVTGWTMDGCIRKAKKKAYKSGGDSVIGVEMKTGHTGSGAFGFYSSATEPVLSGWIAKCSK